MPKICITTISAFCSYLILLCDRRRQARSCSTIRWLCSQMKSFTCHWPVFWSRAITSLAGHPKTSNISRPPLLILPLQLLVFAETFTTANKTSKSPFIVANVPLTIVFPDTESFPLSVVVVKLVSLFFIIKQLPNNFIVLRTPHSLLHQ